MKKYFQLTAREAIVGFLHKDNTLAPEAADEIRTKLAHLRELKNGICVTIVIPTHRISPDRNIDAILLKNKVYQAERQLGILLEKREMWPIAENLRLAEQAIDHIHNLDSLVIYANADFSSVVKLPVDLTEKVTIGDHFDMTPLYKTMQQNRHYYILTVSKQLIRLLEAMNDKLVEEITEGDFPFVKNSFYTVSSEKPVGDGFEEKMEKEFYNDADKSFQQIYNERPLPVILAGDVKSIAYYREQMDNDSIVIATLQGNYDQTSIAELLKTVYPEVEKYRSSNLQAHLSDIERARSAELLVTSTKDILESAANGAAETLYIEDSFSFYDKDDAHALSDQEMAALRRRTDEMLMGLLRNVNMNGGNIVFMEDGSLDTYGGIVLTARFLMISDSSSENNL